MTDEARALAEKLWPMIRDGTVRKGGPLHEIVIEHLADALREARAAGLEEAVEISQICVAEEGPISQLEFEERCQARAAAVREGVEHGE